MNELTPAARAILDAGRHLDDPSDLEKARVRQALLAKITPAGAIPAERSTPVVDSGANDGPVGPGSHHTLAAASRSLATILVPLAVIVGVGAGSLVVWQVQRTVTTLPVTTAGIEAPGPVPTAPLIEPTQTSSLVTSVRRPAHGIRGVTPVHAVRETTPTSRLDEEMALLAAANADLQRGDPRRALRLLEDYDRRYPAGVLREEVLATRLIARCQLGTDQDAHSEADTFLAHHQASLLAPRVRAACVR